MSFVGRWSQPKAYFLILLLERFPRKGIRRSMGRYPSGQRGQTVNLLPSASKVRILASPPNGACSTRSALGVRHEIMCVVATGSEKGGRSSGVELQPSKLAVASSNLVARSKPSMGDCSGAHVAQLAEHVLGKDEVTRSIRVVGSIPCLTRPEAPSINMRARIFSYPVFSFVPGIRCMVEQPVPAIKDARYSLPPVIFGPERYDCATG